MFSLSPVAVVFFSLLPSLSLFAAPAGRPGSRVFPHQQYPCWRCPKGESVCLRNIHTFCPDHLAQILPQRRSWADLGRRPQCYTLFSSVVCQWADCCGALNPPIPTKELFLLPFVSRFWHQTFIFHWVLSFGGFSRNNMQTPLALIYWFYNRKAMEDGWIK